MKRNSKSKNDGRENKRNRSYYITCVNHSEFTRLCRKSIRAKAKQAIREGNDPLPKDPKAKEYYD